jgi:S1-C subfamily serine protease
MIRNPNGTIPPRRYYLGAAALVLFGLVIGLGLSSSLGLQKNSDAQKSSGQSTVSGGAAPESPFVAVVEKALPAVVFVDVRKKVAANDSDDPQADLYRRFFGEQMPTWRPAPRGLPERRQTSCLPH